MAFAKICLVVAFVGVASATPTTPAFFKSNFFGTTVEEMRSMCNNDDAIACIKFKALSFIENLFNNDKYQLSEDVEITRNSFRSNEVDSRGESSFEENLEKYIKTHDVTFKLPFADTKITLDSKNLEEGEIDLKLKLSGDVEARKSKLKKIFMPILVFVLLKAITLIPLALGVLGLKAWNALQLSFFSFVVSVSLAVFQLCKKIAADNAHPHIAAHAPWDAHYARSLDDAAQEMAYSAYRK